MEESNFDHKVKRVIKSVERDKLIADLKNFDDEIVRQDKGQSVWKKWLSIAAVFMIVSFGIYYITSERKPTSATLYATYFTPYKNIIEPIIRNDDAESLNLQQKAFTYYELKQYEKALPLFDSLQQREALDINTLNFYRANIYLEFGDSQKAISLLEAMNASEFLKDQRLWYLSLAFLKNNELEKAEDILKTLESTSSYKKKETSILLENLSKISKE